MTVEKVVIIGGSSGMGLATAKRLAKDSYNVVIGGRNQNKIDLAIEEIDGAVSGVSVDFTNRSDLDRFFETIGPFDHLVCMAAGSAAWGNFQDLDPEKVRLSFEKFWGYFHTSQASLKNLSKKGSITFIIGAVCRSSIPGTSAVSAANGAILSMGLTLAKELKTIRVNLISPGVVDTPLYDYMSPSEKNLFFAQMGKNLPVGRIGQADEIAKTVQFVLSNGYLTGAVIDVDGGARLK